MRREKKEGTKRQVIRVFKEGRFSRVSTDIVREVPLRLYLNGAKIVTIACAGIHLRELAVGYLRSEGMIGARRDLKKIRVTEGPDPAVHITAGVKERPDPAALSIGSSGARGKGKWETTLKEALPSAGMKLSPGLILRVMDQLLRATKIHEATRGTHCSGLAGPSGMIVTREDIGRHNTIDMLGGYLLLEGVYPSGKAIVTTGRVSAEIVTKVARMGVPAIVSHSAPTTKAVALCRDLGMTLIGYVRDGSFRVYAERKGHEVGKLRR
jgi:FdhD protein